MTNLKDLRNKLADYFGKLVYDYNIQYLYFLFIWVSRPFSMSALADFEFE